MTAGPDDGRAALAGTPYRYVAPLGEGGMGTVVEAEHIGLAQRVVVKLIRQELVPRVDLVDRLRVEARALARLSHPNLVRVSDFGTNAAGRAYLVMERLHGRSLASELARRRPLPVAEATALVRQALAGLEAAHAAGLVHRDIKPENLFLCDDGTLKVLDFGVAKVVDEAALSGLVQPRFSTHEGGMVGTPQFAAPEQLEGGAVSPATDVYATGLVLYELVTGSHPFARHKSVDALHHAQLVEMPPLPSSVAPQAIPPDVDRAILRAIAKRPGDRFASAADFARALTGVMGLDSRSAPTLASARESPTLISAVASESVPTLALRGGSSDAPTLELPQKTTELPALCVAPAPAPRRSEGLGVLCLIAGLITALWKLTSALGALPELWDPIGFVESLRGKVPPAVAQDVTLLSRAAAAATLLDSLVLMLVGAGLVVIGVVLMQRTPRGPALARRASTGALIVVAASVLLNLAVVVPLRGALVDRLPGLPDALPGLETLGFAFGVVLLLGLSALEVGFLLLVRAWSRRLDPTVEAGISRPS